MPLIFESIESVVCISSALMVIRTPLADTIFLRKAEHLTAFLRKMVSARGVLLTNKPELLQWCFVT